jgi:hypothetical protein
MQQASFFDVARPLREGNIDIEDCLGGGCSLGPELHGTLWLSFQQHVANAEIAVH